jgi:hypothetical protein
MNRSLLLLGLLLVSGCVAPVEPEATRAQANTRKETPRPASRLFVNERAVAEVSPGWPLLISLELRHPQTGPAELRLQPSVRFALVGPSGPVEVAAKGIDLPAEVRLSDSADGRADLAWLIRGEDTARLGLGTYALHATLGDVELDVAEINVRAQADDPEWRTQGLRAWHRASRRMPGVTFPEAELDAALQAHPDYVGLLRLKGRRMESRGDRAAASELYQRALTAFEQQNPKAQEPPDSLHRDLLRVSR